MRDMRSWPDGAPPAELAEMLRVARSEKPGAHVLAQALASLTAASAGATWVLGVGAKTATAASAQSVVSAAAAAPASAAAAAPASLGAGTAVAPVALGPAAATKAGTLTLLVLAKWGGAGFLAGTLALGASTLPSQFAPKANTQQPSATRLSGAQHPARGAAVAQRGLGPRGAKENEFPVASSERPLRASGGPPLPPVTRPHAPSANDPRFRRELRLVDDARSALGRGQPEEALGLLAVYQREFGSAGHFAPEALYLQLEAHSRAGDRRRAQADARAILERYPDGPHASRAHSELAIEKP